MNNDFLYFNQICEQINTERIKLFTSPQYRIGRKVCKVPGVKRLWKFMGKEPAQADTEGLPLQAEDIAWHPRVAIYQAVIGKYDAIRPAWPFCPDIYDCFLFTDSEPADPELAEKNWKVKPIPENVMSLSNPILINRYLKMHPHELFPGYDYAVYTDGNIQIVADIRPLLRKVSPETGLALHKHSLFDCAYDDIQKFCLPAKRGNIALLKKQIEKYRREGFPRHFGMFECGVIVSDLHNAVSKKILSAWWEELASAGILRDQPVLPYTLWRNGFVFTRIGQFGVSLYKNPKLILKFRKRDE